MSRTMDAKQQLNIIKKKTVEIISEEELLKKLNLAASEKRPLNVKYGADPSAPDIHLGHTVALNKLREFQELGHKVIFIIGDFTARIGDPSGRVTTRKRLSKEDVKKNALTYQEQVFKLLDKKRTTVVFNSSWFDKMRFGDVVDLSSRFTVARMLERDDFARRFKQNQPITVLEFLYPLIQGYDSIKVKADIEIGGTDQTFNFLVGRNLQRDYGQEPQVVITLPLLEGTDGKLKMSKSLNNYIGISERPRDIFGKIMSVSDELMLKFYELLTDIPASKIKKLHPMRAKTGLASFLVSRYYGSAQAKRAEKEFEKVFSRKELPTIIPRVEILSKDLKSGKIWIVKLLKLANLTSTNSEARRLIKQGGVRIDREPVRDPEIELPIRDGMIVQAGKRNFIKVFRA